MHKQKRRQKALFVASVQGAIIAITNSLILVPLIGVRLSKLVNAEHMTRLAILAVNARNVPMPGKFEGNADPELAEFLYERSMQGWQDADKGESDYGGWYCLFIFEGTDVKVAEADDRGILARLGNAYVCHEDSNGFWTCSVFDTAEEARRDYDSAPEWGANDALLDMVEQES
jgi:hypothetical protein